MLLKTDRIADPRYYSTQGRDTVLHKAGLAQMARRANHSKLHFYLSTELIYHMSLDETKLGQNDKCLKVYNYAS